MNKFTRRFAAVVTTGALVVGGLALTATAANADMITGNIKLFSKGSAVGTVASTQVTSGSSTTNPMYWGITVDQGCPAGYQDGASIQIAQGGVRIAGIGKINTVINDGKYGVNGLKTSDGKVAMDESSTTPSQNPYVDNNYSLESAAAASAATLVTGAFEVRYYCNADNLSPDFVNDKFFSLTLNFDSAAHTWTVPVPKIATTTAITAQADQTAKTATISTTVKLASDGSNATAATGTATVSETAPTAAVLGTATVANGVATFTSSALTAGMTYYFAVTYSGDASYNGSTSSIAYVTINGATTGGTNVTFTVAPGQNQGAKTLSGVPTSVDLGIPTYSGTAHTLTYTNASSFSGITVTDYRSLDSSSWSLTGSVGDFTSTVGGLSGKFLGWSPSVTSGPTGYAAGGVVAAAASSAPSTGGLKSISQLSTAPVVDGSAVTVSSAILSLVIPANTKSGAYSALLTLTLA